MLWPAEALIPADKEGHHLTSEPWGEARFSRDYLADFRPDPRGERGLERCDQASRSITAWANSMVLSGPPKSPVF